MILSKASKLSLLAGLLCLLLMGFAGASYGAVRFDVVPSPTEVINTGRSEVLGGFNLVVFSTGVTGTSTGAFSQIGMIYTNGVQIDNTTATGIKLVYSTGFNSGVDKPAIVAVSNLSITGRCSGFITINIPPGLTVQPNDFIHVEGVRGRIDLSDGAVAGTDLFVQLQSINDPAANTFFPETVRVAKSLPGLVVDVKDDNLLLCFPTLGQGPGDDLEYRIRVTEGFVRAFVNYDTSNVLESRADSTGNLLGSPVNATKIRFVLNSIPASVDDITWPTYSANVTDPAALPNSYLKRDSNIDESFENGIATAVYIFYSQDQTGYSDITLETFDVKPLIELDPDNLNATGTVLAAASLYPFVGSKEKSCMSPGNSDQASGRPRFVKLNQSSAGVTSTSDSSTSFDLYATVVRCNCFLLYTYVAKDSFWDTGIAIANTTGDIEVFGEDFEAPDQLGAITFYFYDKDAGFVGSTTTSNTYAAGKSFVGLLSQLLPTGVTSFHGYVIAKAQFQFCHGYAFLSDTTFAQIAQGYLANVIPDPAIKGSPRTASAAGDITNVPAGESLNN